MAIEGLLMFDQHFNIPGRSQNYLPGGTRVYAFMSAEQLPQTGFVEVALTPQEGVPTYPVSREVVAWNGVFC